MQDSLPVLFFCLKKKLPEQMVYYVPFSCWNEWNSYFLTLPSTFQEDTFSHFNIFFLQPPARFFPSIFMKIAKSLLVLVWENW